MGSWRSRAVAGPVLASLLAVTGCGVLNGEPEEEPDPARAALVELAERVRADGTLRGSFTVYISGQGDLTGDSEVAAGSAMAGGYAYESDLAQPGDDPVTGELLVVAEEAYLRSSQWELPPDRDWFAVARYPAMELDAALPPEWWILAASPLFDPLFLLDQGLPEAGGFSTNRTVRDGADVTTYATQWHLELTTPGPELSAWAADVVGAAYLDLTLFVDAGGRLVELEVSTSGAVGLFSLRIGYAEHGADLELTAPPAEAVATEEA